MERFIHNENLRHFRKLLAEEKDEERRNVIRKLLAEEEAKDVPKGSQADPIKSPAAQAWIKGIHCPKE